jgi:hypothetical protein
MQSESVEILQYQLMELQNKQLKEWLRIYEERENEYITLRGKTTKLKNVLNKPNINPMCFLFTAMAARNLDEAQTLGLPQTMTDEDLRLVLKVEKEEINFRGKRMKF